MLPLCCHLKHVGLPVAIIFLRVDFRPFSFFTRTMRAKINPDDDDDDNSNIIFTQIKATT